MSYNVSLVEPLTRKPVRVQSHYEGGIIALGGMDTAEMSVSYNYWPHFAASIDAADGLRWLYDRTGQEAAPRLREAVAKLGVAQDEDYWKATPGNAGHALAILLGWAEQHPTAIFEGD